jgi:hypothetical protein
VGLDGIDLVLDGEATRVTDPATPEELAGRYRDVGWPAEVDGDAFTAPFSAPSAGPPPWHLYRFTARTAVGVATAEPHGATRWRYERRRSAGPTISRNGGGRRMTKLRLFGRRRAVARVYFAAA